jgi:SET domain-containing protein
MKIPKVIDQEKYKVKKGLNGLGLFATETIKDKSWIIEYVGKKLTNKQSENLTTQYLFDVSDTYTIDGSPRYNTARYINYSCNPNAEAWNIEDRIFIRAIKPILAGSEITYDYGKEFFDKFIKPKGCHCGAPECKSPVSSKKKSRPSVLSAKKPK